MRSLAVLTLALLAPLALHAECRGQDLILRMPDADRAALEAEVAARPFPNGNYWRAVKGDEVLTVIGTLHLDDPRFDAVAAALALDLAEAGALMVEAGPVEMAEMQAMIARDPSYIVNTDGPTLPEMLPKADWAALSAAMRDRGIPGFMAAKFRPWYVLVLMAMPPCVAQEMIAKGETIPNGLDQRLIAEAEGLGLPILALEDWKAALGVFQNISPEDQMALLLSSMAVEDQSEDFLTTTVGAYFRGEAALTWAMNRKMMAEMPGMTEAELDRMLALVEGPLLADRNRAWIPVIEATAAETERPLVVAFGALHLPGEAGVLNLLTQSGWAVTPLEF